MHKPIIDLCSEVLSYFAAQDHYLKFGDKASHLKMLQLSATLPVTTKRIMADLQEMPDHKKEADPPNLADLLSRQDLIELVFLDKGVYKLSRSAINLVARCDDLKISHNVLLELEQEYLIELVPGTEEFPHYQRTGKI